VETHCRTIIPEIMSLSGKAAIVTGGARGIGAGMIRALARQGAKVSLTSAPDHSPRNPLIRNSTVPSTTSPNPQRSPPSHYPTRLELQAPKPYATRRHVHPLRPSDPHRRNPLRLLHAQIDILINNAGEGGNAPLEDVTLSTYDHLMSINVRSVLFMTQAILPHIPGGGRIIKLASISVRGSYATQSLRGEQGGRRRLHARVGNEVGA
jgi:3-oxoacyl-[acyl-carrier protein] reductase